MCLIAIGWQAHLSLPLVIVANRDEFYQRKSQSMHFWDDQPNLLAGRDLQAGGTWLGVNTQGRFAALTNVRETSPPATETSRGSLIGMWLNNQPSSPEFVRELASNANTYGGYNLLFGDTSQLLWASNRSPEGFAHRYLASGIYGLGNASLNTPWPKLRLAKQRLATQLKLANPTITDLAWATADTCTQDDLSCFGNTGMEESWLRALSAQWISTPEYGTRAQTVITLTNTRQMHCYERTVSASGNTTSEQTFQFTL
jgi:uncharacterized protein with NRDE domain